MVAANLTNMLARNQTTPCLLQEIIRFNFQPAVTENNGPSPSCNHVYVSNPNRTRVPSLKHLPSASTTYSVAGTCQHCRRHFDALLDFPANTQPCPSQTYPFHLFQYKRRDEEQNLGIDTNQVMRFQCSAETCRAELILMYRLPVLEKDDIAFLTSPDLLEARARTAQLIYPEGRVKSALEVLKTFRTAVVDSLEKEDKDMRDIPVDNKVFKYTLGDGVDDLFTRLGFSKIVSSGKAKVHWRLPRPAPHPLDPMYDNMRTRLEDVRDELSIMMLQRPEAERKLLTSWIPLPLPFMQPDLERILGIQSSELSLPPPPLSGRAFDTRRSRWLCCPPACTNSCSENRYLMPIADDPSLTAFPRRCKNAQSEQPGRSVRDHVGS